MDIMEEIKLLRKENAILRKDLEIILAQMNKMQEQINVLFDQNRMSPVESLQMEFNKAQEESREVISKERLRELRDEIKKLRGYARGNRYTQRELARDSGLYETELSGRLNGTSKVKITCENINSIIQALIKRGCITDQEQVEKILDITGCSNMLPAEVFKLIPEKNIPISTLEKLKRRLFIGKPEEILREFSLETIEKFIRAPSEETNRRIQALEIYLHRNSQNQKLFSTLSVDNDPKIRQSIAEMMGVKNMLISIDDIVRLIKDLKYEVAEQAVKSTVNLVREGRVPISVLSEAATHKYWLVKVVAIRYIVEADSEESMSLLYRFKDVKYHISKSVIGSYILKRYKDKNLEGIEYEMAIEILNEFVNDGRVSEEAREKAAKILSIVQPNNL